MTWKTFWRDLTSSVNSQRTQDEIVEEENQLGAKLIVILFLTGFFAVCITCLLLAILYKWLRRSREKESSERSIPRQREEQNPSKEKPLHTKLMRTDSSRSVIVDNSRDASSISTPLSPLSEEDSTFSFDRGRLEFSIFFDREQENLKVSIIQCHGLRQRSCIYYVQGILLPDHTTTQKTTVRYHNPSPVFEEVLKFSLPFDELSERTLCLNVFELDDLSGNRPVGHVLYSFDTENNNYMDLMRMDVELNRERPQDVFGATGIGEVLLSLCYLPTAGRLTLIILKCRLYQAQNGLPNPFVKVALMLNRKQIKKIKTSVKCKTLTPAYNESFIFDVPAQHIANVSLYARILNDRKNQEILGKVMIGSTVGTSLGVHHWEHMILRPRKPIVQWHKIL